MSDYSIRVYRLFVFRAFALCVLLFLTSTPLASVSPPPVLSLYLCLSLSLSAYPLSLVLSFGFSILLHCFLLIYGIRAIALLREASSF